MQGEEVRELHVAAGGVVGDRAYGFIEVATGKLVTAKQHGALLGCHARYLAPPVADDSPSPIEVTFPDGTVVRDDEAELVRQVTALLGVAVRLVTSPPGTLVDLAAVHIVAASTLRDLAAAHPEGDWDPRRLRPNVLLEGTESIGGDDGCVGRVLHLGEEVVIHVAVPTPRCVMTTLPQADLSHDREILRTLVRVATRQVGSLGEFPCAGAYAEVVNPGVMRTGDRVFY